MDQNNLCLGGGARPFPHPGPFPKGEGERHLFYVHQNALFVTPRWLTFSLSAGERAGVRGNAFLITTSLTSCLSL